MPASAGQTSETVVEAARVAERALWMFLGRGMTQLQHEPDWWSQSNGWRAAPGGVCFQRYRSLVAQWPTVIELQGERGDDCRPQNPVETDNHLGNAG
jgi:hypothetical protein